jgi:hypothetical protein
MLVSRVTIAAAVIQLLAIDFDATEVVALLEERGKFFYRRFVLWIAGFFFVKGDDACDWLSPAEEDEAFAGFDFGDAGGEVLVGFAERDAAHE